jgi:outer membrane receptor for ferrienterochelin and colicin
VPFSRPLACALLIACSAGTHDSVAEDEQPSLPLKQEPKKQEKIEVEAGGATDQRRASTAAKIVVNHDELVEYGDTTLLDAVKRLPGITVQGSSIRMRGMAGGYTQILVDGDPIPPGFSIETLSPDLIERIEIYRSPTAEFSTQSIAGTINIVLRKAVSHRRRELKGSISTNAGAPSGYLTGQLADRMGALTYTLPFSLNIYGFRWRSDARQLGWDAAGIPNLDYTTGDAGHGHGVNAGLSPKLSWSWGKDHTLLWESFGSRSRRASATTIARPSRCSTRTTLRTSISCIARSTAARPTKARRSRASRSSRSSPGIPSSPAGTASIRGAPRAASRATSRPRAGRSMTSTSGTTRGSRASPPSRRTSGR